jgi:hypothetical protein
LGVRGRRVTRGGGHGLGTMMRCAVHGTVLCCLWSCARLQAGVCGGDMPRAAERAVGCGQGGGCWLASGGSCGRPVPARPAAAGGCTATALGTAEDWQTLLLTAHCSLRTAHLSATCSACQSARLPAAAAGAALSGACRTPAAGPASRTSGSPPPPGGCTPWCCSDRTSLVQTPCAAQPAPVLQAAPGHCTGTKASQRGPRHGTASAHGLS